MDPQEKAIFSEPLDDEERELMGPDQWDWDSAELMLPVEKPGAIFAVRFSREELTRVAEAARAAGLTTSAFIKQSTMTRVLQDAPR
jgi:hypothetical protein